MRQRKVAAGQRQVDELEEPGADEDGERDGKSPDDGESRVPAEHAQRQPRIEREGTRERPVGAPA
ncbi:MAG: hypothetical protein R2752_15970 [Vicinamibacterales bacterium]